MEVVPARWTLRELDDLRDELTRAIDASDWPRGVFRAWGPVAERNRVRVKVGTDAPEGLEDRLTRRYGPDRLIVERTGQWAPLTAEDQPTSQRGLEVCALAGRLRAAGYRPGHDYGEELGQDPSMRAGMGM